MKKGEIKVSETSSISGQNGKSEAILDPRIIYNEECILKKKKKRFSPSKNKDVVFLAYPSLIPEEKSK